MNNINKILEDKSQEIIDLFFEKGVRISKKDYDKVLEKLTQVRQEAIKEFESEIDKLDRCFFEQSSGHEWIDTCQIYKVIQKAKSNLKELLR